LRLLPSPFMPRRLGHSAVLAFKAPGSASPDPAGCRSLSAAAVAYSCPVAATGMSARSPSRAARVQLCPARRTGREARPGPLRALQETIQRRVLPLLRPAAGQVRAHLRGSVYVSAPGVTRFQAWPRIYGLGFREDEVRGRTEA